MPTVLGLSVTQIRPLRSFVTFFRTQLKKTEEEMDETLKDYLTLCDGKHPLPVTDNAKLSQDLNTVTFRIPDVSGIQMVDLYRVVKCSGIQMVV